jgi:hypothetical protein
MLSSWSILNLGIPMFKFKMDKALIQGRREKEREKERE